MLFYMDSTTQKKIYEIIITKDHDEGGFIGRCDELHANSQGETYGNVMENMKEAVELAAEEHAAHEHENMIDFDLLVILKQ